MHQSARENAPVAEAERQHLQRFFFDRIERLIALRAQNDPSWTEAQRRLIDRAIASTYWDCQCVSMDVEIEAAAR